MQLLVICGINASDKVLLIAQALVLIKNTEWWTWVLEALKGCFPKTDQECYVFILDCEKGISLSLSKVFPKAFQAYCCQHIADNVRTKYGNKCRPLFQACARAKTKQAYENALKELWKHKVVAAKYINAILHETQTWYAFLLSRFGYDTSNISELINSAWLDIRSMLALQMLDGIYLKVMKTIYKRSYRNYKSNFIVNV